MQTEELQASVFKTGDGVFAVDHEQRIISWNQGAEAILGYAPAEVMGRPCFEVIRGVDESGKANCYYDCPMISCARRGKLPLGQHSLVKGKDGFSRWLSITHAVISPLHNHLATVVHVFRDSTPEIEAKRLVARIADQLSSYGLPQSPAGRVPGLGPELTARENQVLELLAQGEGTSSVAKTLTVSNTTARNHIQNILAKLGVHTRLEAVAFALRHSLVDPGLVNEKQALEEKLGKAQRIQQKSVGCEIEAPLSVEKLEEGDA